jgi:hypothetical protein
MKEEMKMKNVLGLIMLGVAAVAATTHGQQIIEETLMERNADVCRRYGASYRLPENARERVLEGGVSPGWARDTLEGIVRKNMPILMKQREEQELWRVSRGHLPASYRALLTPAYHSILVLREFPDPKTLALLRECLLTPEHYEVHDAALLSYIVLEGGNSTPCLKELIEKKVTGNSTLSQRLRQTILPDLKKQGRDEDIHKFHAFMLEQLQTEQRWTGGIELDATLCLTLEGYAQSIQREQAIQKHINSENRYAREGFAGIKAAIDAIPADQRTDLSGRFKSSDGIPAVEKSSDGIPAVEKSGDGFQPLEATEPPQRQDAVAPPPNRPWLYLVLLALAVIILGGVVAWCFVTKKPA